MSEKGIEIVKLKREGDLYVCQIDGQEFGFRRWSWGEKNRTVGACTRLNANGIQYLDIPEFNLTLLMSTLKKAPFPVNRQTIEEYKDPQLIDKLIQITTKLNILGSVEIQNL